MALTTGNLIEIMSLLINNGTQGKSLLMLGKQTIVSKGRAIIPYMEKMLGANNIEKLTQYLDMDKNPDSIELFKMMGLNEVHALDYSDYEGADIICDLNEELYEYMQFDYILDGGVLEHIFNCAQALKNIFRMTKKGGYIIHLNPISGYINHGFYSFSPELYTSFYKENGCEIEKITGEFIIDDDDDPNKWKSFFSCDFRQFDQWIEVRNYVAKLSKVNAGGRVLIHCVVKKNEDVEPDYPVQQIWKEMYKKWSW